MISSGDREQFSRIKGGCWAEQGDQMSIVHGDAGTKGSELREQWEWGWDGAVDRERLGTSGDWGSDQVSPHEPVASHLALFSQGALPLLGLPPWAARQDILWILGAARL